MDFFKFAAQNAAIEFHQGKTITDLQKMVERVTAAAKCASCEIEGETLYDYHGTKLCSGCHQAADAQEPEWLERPH